MEAPRIKEFKRWSAESVRNACIANELYTNGSNEDYQHMLCWVSRLYPNTENILFIAEDIAKHSEERPITNVMFILANEAVTTTYEFEED